jgi:hypothetical protein
MTNPDVESHQSTTIIRAKSPSRQPDAIIPADSPEAQLLKVATMEEYLRQCKDTSDTTLFEVTLIRREAERRMGQLLLEIPRHPGIRTDLTSRWSDEVV